MKFLTSSLAFLTSIIASAQNTTGLDERIDAAFGRATGWFVDLIFYEIDVAGVKQVCASAGLPMRLLTAAAPTTATSAGKEVAGSSAAVKARGSMAPQDA